MIDRGAESPLSFGEKSYYYGTNIPGKPKRYLLNSGGRPKFFSIVADVVANDYDSFTMSRATEAATSTLGGLRGFAPAAAREART
jgi:hypothetical protein